MIKEKCKGLLKDADMGFNDFQPDITANNHLLKLSRNINFCPGQ